MFTRVPATAYTAVPRRLSPEIDGLLLGAGLLLAMLLAETVRIVAARWRPMISCLAVDQCPHGSLALLDRQRQNPSML